MNLKAFGIGLTTLTLAACASQPTQPTAANVAAPAVAAPAAAPAPNPAAEAVPVAATADGKPLAPNPNLIKAGYKATTIKGQVVYCRQEEVTGTTFKQKVCLNEEQMRVQEQRTKEMQEQMLKPQTHPACFGKTCD